MLAISTTAIWRATVGVALCAAVLLYGAAGAHALVLHSKTEALQIAFPEAERVETLTFYLTEAQAVAVQDRAKAPVDSKLITFHVGHAGGAVLGYAFIETHIVRTFPETFLIVVSPDGRVEKLLVLAFYEPPEYLPPDRWLAQFDEKALSPALRLRRDVHGIMGSTLTAQAVTRGVRKVLALFQVLIRERP